MKDYIKTHDWKFTVKSSRQRFIKQWVIVCKPRSSKGTTLSLSRLFRLSGFQVIPVCSRLFQFTPGYSSLLQVIPVYSRLFQFIHIISRLIEVLSNPYQGYMYMCVHNNLVGIKTILIWAESLNHLAMPLPLPPLMPLPLPVMPIKHGSLNA